MNNFDVAIIGGGISGLSAALILSAAVKDNSSLKARKICIIDAGGSDALKAKFFNAPGIKPATTGKKVIRKLREQVASYNVAEIIDKRVRTISKTDNGFLISSKRDKNFFAQAIILATGFRKWDIEGLDLPIKQFTRTTNPSRVALHHDDYKVADGIYVCGLLSDVSSHYPIVAGTGAQVAINLLHDWTGEWIVVHDK